AAQAAAIEREGTTLCGLMEKLFGSASLAAMQAEQQREQRNLELAFFADAATVECYAGELELAATIETELTRLFHMLRDLKRQKHEERKRENATSLLLPPYGRRVR